jgi:hypothetical protein
MLATQMIKGIEANARNQIITYELMKKLVNTGILENDS